MPFTGSCHCGAIAYTLEEPAPTGAMACNCSICRRKGYLLHFTAPEKFTLTADPAAITEYKFNQHNIAHRFCNICGCSPHGGGTGPDGKEVIAINLRCANGIDLDALEILHYDGASL